MVSKLAGELGLTSPFSEPVLLQLLHLQRRRLVVHLQDPDEVGDGEHPDEPGHRGHYTQGRGTFALRSPIAGRRARRCTREQRKPS